jgi:hypothetical protein
MSQSESAFAKGLHEAAKALGCSRVFDELGKG